jgi:hypothetical protein
VTAIVRPLDRFGLTENEVYECEALSDGRIMVPAVIEGEPGKLLLQTGTRLDISLDLAYVRARGFPFERRQLDWGMSPLPDFQALGRTRPHSQVVVWGVDGSDGERYATDGSIGSPYFTNSILFIDTAEPVIGISTNPGVRASFEWSTQRVPLIPATPEGLPLTTAIRDALSPEATPVFLIDTSAYSTIALDFVDRWWPRRERERARKAVERNKIVTVNLHLPGGLDQPLEMYVSPHLPQDAARFGVPRIDGVLGIDFLYQWVYVFDFAGRELVLFEY